METTYYNPYTGETFFSVLWQLLLRLSALITGKLPVDQLVSDEIQILVLTGVSISTALLGCFLVLRRMTMLANALSHTILLGIVLAYILTTPSIGALVGTDHPEMSLSAMLWASLITGLVTTYLTEFLHKTLGLQEDASIGLVFTTLFAIGILMVTLLTRSAHIGTEVVMGSVDALQLSDCSLVYLMALINGLAVVAFYKELQITTFDIGLSTSLGISPTRYNYLLMTLLSATAIAAFRAVGVLMVLTFITAPPLTARFLTDRLHTLLLIAIGLGIGASVIGVALSRHLLTVYGLAFSTSGIVVCVLTVLFTVVFIGSIIRSKSFKKLKL